MLTLELLEITETMVKYKYYPEALKEYGIRLKKKLLDMEVII